MSLFPCLAAEEKPFAIKPKAEVILEEYCNSCHEDGTTKDDIQLDNVEREKELCRS